MRAVLRVSGREDALAAAALLAEAGYEVVDPGEVGLADLVVVDEWTPESAEHVVDARRRGIPTTVLAEMILDRAPHPVIAVTGTAGKTSTCRALAHILTSCGADVAISTTARSANAWPDHSLAGGIPEGAVTIAELTSTHLCHMRSVRADIGVVTTVRPDHVELHGGLDRYVAAKRRLADAVPDDSCLVLPVDDPDTLRALGLSRPTWGFGVVYDEAAFGAFLASGAIRLVGPGGTAAATSDARGTALRSALAAAAAALALGVDIDGVVAALAAVPAVMHRMHAVAAERGITVIDDTMAATPLKARAALGDSPLPPHVVIVGGDDALSGPAVHASPEERVALGEALAAARRRPVVIAFGPAATRVAEHIAIDHIADGIDDALSHAVDRCPDGGTVLVSPMFPMTSADRARVARSGRPR